MGCTHRRGGEDGEGGKDGKSQGYPGAAGCWDGLSVLVQHTRHQVITQDLRAGQEQFAVKSFSLNTPGEAGMSKIPAKAS